MHVHLNYNHLKLYLVYNNVIKMCVNSSGSLLHQKTKILIIMDFHPFCLIQLTHLRKFQFYITL